MVAELVSVIIPAYAHENHIEAAIVSAQKQKYDALEILVQDDCSPDATWAIIENLARNDSRITATRTAQNMGAAANHLDLLSRAKGRFVALLSSDDVWHPHKTALQVELMERNADAVAVFGQPEIIDGSGVLCTETGLGRQFAKPISPGTAVIRRLFDQGNMLCHPASLIRREALLAMPNLENVRMFANLPDLFFWIGLGGLGDLIMHDDIVTQFRLHNDESNASAATMCNNIRDRNEFQYVLRAFADYQPDRLHAIFPDQVEAGLSQPAAVIRFAQYAARLRPRSYAAFALAITYDVMRYPAHVDICAEEIGFDLKALHHLTGWCDSLGTGQPYLDKVIAAQWQCKPE